MRRYPVPNLRRDLPISVVLLVAALAAVVPHRAMVIMALATTIMTTPLLDLLLGRRGFGDPPPDALPVRAR